MATRCRLRLVYESVFFFFTKYIIVRMHMGSVLGMGRHFIFSLDCLKSFLDLLLAH